MAILLGHLSVSRKLLECCAVVRMSHSFFESFLTISPLSGCYEIYSVLIPFSISAAPIILDEFFQLCSDLCPNFWAKTSEAAWGTFILGLCKKFSSSILKVLSSNSTFCSRPQLLIRAPIRMSSGDIEGFASMLTSHL